MERLLLESARGDAPADSSRQRALVALGLTAAPAVPSASPTPAGTTVAMATKWWLVAVVTGAVAGGGVAQWALSRRPAPMVAQAPCPAPATAPSPTPVVEVAAAGAAAADPTPAPAPAVRLHAHAPPSDGDRLALEIRLLDQARQALAADRPAQALAALDRHHERCPEGVLRAEAMALRVEALLHAGARTEARALAARFLLRFPQSPLGERVRRLVPDADGPPAEDGP
jgi:hypothetical protein